MGVRVPPPACAFRGRIGSGASYANGGWLCPAQAGPLPEPGLTLYGMRALFDRDSALYFKPGDLRRLAPWLLRFRTYYSERDHARGTAAIGQLGRDVFDLIEEMRADGVEFELHKQGMVYAARDVEDARNELGKLAPMRQFGYDLPNDVITGSELQELAPWLSSEGDRRVPCPPALACKSGHVHDRAGGGALPRWRRDPGGSRGLRVGRARSPDQWSP